MTINNKNKTEKLFPLLLIVILPDDDTSSVSKASNKKMNFLYIFISIRKFIRNSKNKGNFIPNELYL